MKPYTLFFLSSIAIGIFDFTHLIVIFILKRRVWGIFVFSGLFFFTAHIIESTFLNLELYFEHRNYLPSVGLAIAAGYGFVKLNKKLRPLLAVYFVLLVVLGAYNAYSWGGLNRIALSWANENPTSVRSQVLLARYWGSVGDYEKATQAVRNSVNLAPYDGTSHLQLAIHKCLSKGTLGDKGWSELVQGVESAKYYNLGVSDAAGLMVDILRLEACKGYTSENLIDTLTIISNSKGGIGGPVKYNIIFHIAQLHLMNGDFVGYMNALKKCYEVYPTVQIINLQLDTMLVNSFYIEAALYIERGQDLISKGRQSIVDVKSFNQLVKKYENR